MARRKSKPGWCVLCAQHTDLTYEHVPPRAAFNKRRLKAIPHPAYDEAAWAADAAYGNGPQIQGGYGVYSLCGGCNNFLGRKYVPSYVEWTRQLAEIRPSKDSELLLPFRLKPLNVLKQIISMFCVVNASYKGLHERVRKFVLDENCRELNPEFRVFVYCCFGNRVRIQDFVAKISPGAKPALYTEISMVPLGLVLSTAGAHPNVKLCEITHFKSHQFDDARDIFLNIPNLATDSPMLLDYRTRSQIDRDYERNIRHVDGSSG